MPYIDRPRRKDIDALLVPFLTDGRHLNDGEMNYAITRLVLHHTTHGGELAPRYADYEAAIGLLECVKLELYRRAVAPYETHAATKNGDVYP
jgi:hypothetical protein